MPTSSGSVTIVADASRAIAAFERMGRELAAFAAAARRAAGGPLLRERLRVDVSAAAVPLEAWVCPSCVGLLCSACRGLGCHHVCQPGGTIR